MTELHVTKFDGYYVTDNGEIWCHWHKRTGKKIIPRKMNQHDRGGIREKDRYLAICISIKDENYKTIKQIKYYSHRLIAETLIENSNLYPEIDHIDNNKQNNHISNLRWITKRDNNLRHCAKEFYVKDIYNSQIYEVSNLKEWTINNWNWISTRTKIKDPVKFYKVLVYNKKLPKLGFEVKLK